MPFGKTSMYFLPDRVLVYGPGGVGAVEYRDLSISATPIQFIEEGTVPRDATVVDHTWKYVNKSGGPDRRFSNNFKLPICKYGELRFSSPSGIQEVVQLSRLGILNQLGSAMDEIVNAIHEAEVAERNRQSLKEQHKREAFDETFVDALHDAQQSSFVPPVSEALNEALFDAMCCVMVADARASTSEKMKIKEIMKNVNSGWTVERCNDEFSSFIRAVQKQGYKAVVRRSISRLHVFKQSGYENLLVKCVEQVANTEGTPSNAERRVCAKIRELVNTPVS